MGYITYYHQIGCPKLYHLSYRASQDAGFFLYKMCHEIVPLWVPLFDNYIIVTMVLLSENLNHKRFLTKKKMTSSSRQPLSVAVYVWSW